jgi:hypothetical protein
MLKKSASVVLASLRGLTYRSVRLASSLAAASLDGHFEHPVWLFGVISHTEICNGSRSPVEFFRSLLGNYRHAGIA